ncbi:MAG: hypothetical protein KME03_08120 [Aphanocapsa lilacina HA4352-LM1]|jgi:tRNA U34 5-methylaminomethyl-2-thiouridine-forming methyltransferase MnmC|nr:hypothetical protein [Aphanocapsa lilacina HA4352-LM1]
MESNWSIQPTADGSFTFACTRTGRAFHSRTGACREALGKFVRPSGLLNRPEPIRVLDVCYGLGYNSAALLDTLWRVRPTARVELVALDLDFGTARTAHALGGLALWPLAEPLLGRLAVQGTVQTEQLQAQVLEGDARRTLQAVPSAWADGIYLDPFAPEHDPLLWTVEFLSLLAQKLQADGALVTYACGAAVRKALLLAGLAVGSTPPVGRRSPGTIANWHGGLPPLAAQELEHLQTRAAIPYRDPTLTDDASTLYRRRREEQQCSDLEPSSHWKKRWADR